MASPEEMLRANQTWAKETLSRDPGFFEESAKGQSPSTLWIGCADSRVSPDTLTQSHPGNLFVHRNIANMVVHTDFNLLSVLQYSVEHLKVKHVVVCGHYGCGGVKAALSNQDLGMLNKWLRNIKDVYRLHESEMKSLEGEALERKMVECNVNEQLLNLAKTSIIQHAWAERKAPILHGWVYDLGTGLLHEQGTHSPNDALDPIYRLGS